MDEDRRELLELTRSLGAYLSTLRASGAVGLPRAAPTPEGAAGSADAPRPPEERARSGPSRPAAPASSQSPAQSQSPTQSQSPAPSVPALPPEARAPALQVIAEEVAGCTVCPLHQRRTQTVFSRGNGVSGLCFVGEGPGADEDAIGQPFVGKAGQLLDKMIEAMGFAPADVYVANIVKCRPPDNRKPEPAEMAACVGYLERQLEIVQPQVIVALGATAVQGLLGVSTGITRLRGQWKLYRGRIAVMPTFHPAYLLRQPSAKRDVWNDLQAVVQHMGRTLPPKR